MEKKVLVRQTPAVVASTPVAQAAPAKPPAPPTVEERLAGTEALNIWNEIKNRPIDVFAIPNQVVSMYFHPAIVEPSKLYLVMTKATAALPALEVSVGKQFTVEQINKYVAVSRVVDI